jgi:hypothetical protein
VWGGGQSRAGPTGLTGAGVNGGTLQARHHLLQHAAGTLLVMLVEAPAAVPDGLDKAAGMLGPGAFL